MEEKWFEEEYHLKEGHALKFRYKERLVEKQMGFDEFAYHGIDNDVVEYAKKYFPQIAASYDGPRIIPVRQNAFDYIYEHKNKLDIIITDSTDPIGPGADLFSTNYYEHINYSLKKNGVSVNQCESFYFDRDFIRQIYLKLKPLYTYISYYYTLVQTYPSVNIGFTVFSQKINPEDFSLCINREIPNLKYYTPDQHKASFTLPEFAVNLFR
jgi:spermidine synthase